MMEGIKPYQNYKETGSQWLGQVPSTWEVRNLRTLIRPRNERNKPELPLLSVAREKGVFVRSLTDPNENHNVIPDDLSNYKVAKEGSLVINKMKAWQGSMGISPCDGIVSPAYYVYDLTFANRRYAQMLLRSKPYVAHFAQASDGVRVGQWDLSIAGMKQIPVLIPSAEEQDAVVKFLDYATRKLDRALRAKRRTIALLTEQKQSIIQRAVTRGLDASVPLKDSGNRWLGKVPESWSLRPLWTITKVRNEPNPNNLPLLSVFLNMGVILYEQGGGQVHAPSLDLSNYQIVRKGDFVLNNQQAWRGSVGVSPHEGIISPAYFVLKLDDCLDPVFANYLMRSRAMVDQYVVSSKGVGDIQRTIFWPFLRKVLVPIPDLSEQKQIVDYLAKATSKLDVTISNITREIGLLTEYRTRLISDVVTGKLDVREAAKNLPAEIITEPSDDLIDGDEEEIEEAA